MNSATRADIRRALFRAASLDGKYIDKFFPGITPDKKKTLFEPGDPGSILDDDEDETWVICRDKGTNPAHPGRPCVRKFKKGEPTYRCL